MVEIRTVGGYNEVGKNCTAIKIGGRAFIFDMGIHLESYIKHTEDEDIVHVEPEDLIEVGAVPDVSVLNDWRDKVELIMPTHAHLDHVAAIPFLGNRFAAPVLGTPFTIEVLRKTLEDNELHLSNELRILESNNTLNLGNGIKVEFIHITHSTPHTVMIALHTKEGVFLYANDFKLDDTPTLGKKPNYKRLKELSKENVKCLIVDSTYAGKEGNTPSEEYAREKLKEVLLNKDTKGKAVIVTTFSSHIARLQSIIECGKKMGRKIVFLGRSLSKYVEAAEGANIVKFSDDIEKGKYGNQIRRRLKKIVEEKDKYLLVVTGHQGEPQSTLSKMVTGKLPFRFDPRDMVVFSCNIIPTQTNRENREVLENTLKSKQVDIFTGVHESGHASREDLRTLLQLVKPKHIIPAHGDEEKRTALATLAEEEGFKRGDNVHLLKDGANIRL